MIAQKRGNFNLSAAGMDVKTEAECEEKLKALIREMKAEIARAREKAKAE